MPEHERRLLNVPRVEPTAFAKNFIRQAVCEIRFPTLMEIDRRALAELQKPLRKAYPHFSKSESVSVSPGQNRIEGETGYILRSVDTRWAIAVRNSSLSLETQDYRSFEDFERRFNQLLNVSVGFIDSDFFTRLGLRYTNSIPIDGKYPLQSFVNYELVAPLADWIYGTTSKFSQEIRGYVPEGRYTFRHGFDEAGTEDSVEYLLDFDFYAEGIKADDTRGVLRLLNEHSFCLFHWAAGPRTKEIMADGDVEDRA